MLILLKRIIAFLLRLLVLLVVLGYGALILLALMSDNLIFHPHPSSYKPAELRIAGVSNVSAHRIESGSEKISAVYLPNSSAQYTLLFSHGNAEDIGDDLFMLDEYRSAGFAVFAYDYHGYGASEGKPSEKAVYQDADAAYRYLTEQLHVPPNQLIAMGRSLGCAAAVHTAANHPVAGLIIEAPFLSAFRVLTHYQLLPWDKFNNASKMRSIHVPVLVIQGRADRVVPWWHGEHIYQLANQPKQFLWVDGADHNDVLMVAPRKYFEALTAFRNSLRTKTASAPN